MIDITFEVTGNNAEEYKRAMKEGIEAALEALGNQAVSHSKQIITSNIPRHPDSWYTPTGDLRNSISHEVRMDENAVYIGTDIKYAIYNEYGTGKYAGGRSGPWWFKDDDGVWHRTEGISGIHFLRDAVQGHDDEYKSIIINEIKKKLPGYQ